MNRFIAILLLQLSTGCTTNTQNSNDTNAVVENENSQLMEQPLTTGEPYEINFQIEKGADEGYSLVVTMNLAIESHFVSPYSSDQFSGRFNISIEDNDYLTMDSTFIETPRSVEVFDSHPFANGLVNWVRINTSYKHKLNVMSKDDFEVVGMVSFTIEPRCTFEEVEFVISYHDGVMKIKEIGEGNC